MTSIDFPPLDFDEAWISIFLFSPAQPTKSHKGTIALPVGYWRNYTVLKFSLRGLFNQSLHLSRSRYLRETEPVLPIPKIAIKLLVSGLRTQNFYGLRNLGKMQIPVAIVTSRDVTLSHTHLVRVLYCNIENHGFTLRMSYYLQAVQYLQLYIIPVLRYVMLNDNGTKITLPLSLTCIII